MNMGLGAIPRTLPPPTYRLLYNNYVSSLMGQITQEVTIMNTTALAEHCIQYIILIIFKDILDRQYQKPLQPIL